MKLPAFAFVLAKSVSLLFQAEDTQRFTQPPTVMYFIGATASLWGCVADLVR